jgi:hypothetical protein
MVTDVTICNDPCEHALYNYIMLLCAHAYILALPLGQYPLGILPERRQAQQHGKSSNGNINGLTKGPIDTLLKATTCNSQVAEPKERLH